MEVYETKERKITLYKKAVHYDIDALTYKLTEATIHRWPSVRAGEEKWIFPYQENADAMFNTAMIYELAVIKQQAEPLLQQVPENCEEYAEAYRLLKFLKYFHTIPNRQLPPTSLLREFLGGSSFKY